MKKSQVISAGIYWYTFTQDEIIVQDATHLNFRKPPPGWEWIDVTSIGYLEGNNHGDIVFMPKSWKDVITSSELMGSPPKWTLPDPAYTNYPTLTLKRLADNVASVKQVDTCCSKNQAKYINFFNREVIYCKICGNEVK